MVFKQEENGFGSLMVLGRENWNLGEAKENKLKNNPDLGPLKSHSLG